MASPMLIVPGGNLLSPPSPSSFGFIIAPPSSLGRDPATLVVHQSFLPLSPLVAYLSATRAFTS
eukprot:CAMPEP_0172693368 /NCGR_PEP_ID=MMETSP1074-20121228/25938_1 /TAXON_ID=2916 /ORGANISM="Ceratium fusus, Strain PA161109" /LENGTH=63 /DNA_ID=CAMNT_0013513729 /DNA_START=282 /DNA_END=469 /DNA_ORIENTATION=-